MSFDFLPLYAFQFHLVLDVGCVLVVINPQKHNLARKTLEFFWIFLVFDFRERTLCGLVPFESHNNCGKHRACNRQENHVGKTFASWKFTENLVFANCRIISQFDSTRHRIFIVELQERCRLAVIDILQWLLYQRLLLQSFLIFINQIINVFYGIVLTIDIKVNFLIIK